MCEGKFMADRKIPRYCRTVAMAVPKVSSLPSWVNMKLGMVMSWNKQGRAVSTAPSVLGLPAETAFDNSQGRTSYRQTALCHHHCPGLQWNQKTLRAVPES